MSRANTLQRKVQTFPLLRAEGGAQYVPLDAVAQLLGKHRATIERETPKAEIRILKQTGALPRTVMSAQHFHNIMGTSVNARARRFENAFRARTGLQVEVENHYPRLDLFKHPSLGYRVFKADGELWANLNDIRRRYTISKSLTELNDFLKFKGLDPLRKEFVPDPSSMGCIKSYFITVSAVLAMLSRGHIKSKLFIAKNLSPGFSRTRLKQKLLREIEEQNKRSE